MPRRYFYEAGILYFSLIALLTGCDSEPVSKSPVASTAPPPLNGHERMRQLLGEIAKKSGEENGYVGDAHAQKLDMLLDDSSFVRRLTPEKNWELHYESGRAELKLGKEKLAIERLEQALELLPNTDVSALKKTHFELGLAFLRYGETQNCCQLNTSDSCIVPISGSGLHVRREGSQNAIKHFREVLAHPASRDNQEERLSMDEAARWLMNIAYMTLGEYPEGVPEEYLVSPEFFQSEVEFPKFVNVYPKLKLRTFNLCGGAVVDDLDGDEDLDIMTCTWDVTGQTQVFRNNGDGSFDEVTKESGLEGFYGGLNLVQTDYDNDGDLDIFIMRGAWLAEKGMHPNSLLRNDGKLQFTDVTFEAGLGELSCPTKTATWSDYDNDGDLDLYLGNETSDSLRVPCQLFRNEGNGHFTDVAEQAGVADYVFSMGSTWGDYNGDRYPDLYLSLGGANKLYRNNRDGTFTDVARELGVSKPDASFPTWFWDYDNDGNLDIFVGCTSGTIGVLSSNIRFELMHLYRNLGNGQFEDVAERVNLQYPASPMGANYGDLNKDGFPDFYLATGNAPFSEIQPNVMFLNQSGQRFANVTMAGGFGHLQKGHGVSFADIDNDGDQDVYVQLGGAYPGDRFNDALFYNPGFPNHSLTLKLEGRESNRCAIGARIRLDVIEHGEPRSIYHHVCTGSSFGANPLRQAIGVGTAEVVTKLTIDWPVTGKQQIFENVPVDRAFRIIEGEGTLKPIELKAFSLVN